MRTRGPCNRSAAHVSNMKSGVVPGMVITELWDKMGQSKEQQKENFAKSAQKLPVGFVATPEDVSNPS